MRTLNETEMRVAAGGVQPLTRPDPKLCREDHEWVKILIQMQLRKLKVGENP